MLVVFIIKRKWRNGVGRLGSGGFVFLKEVLPAHPYSTQFHGI